MADILIIVKKQFPSGWKELAQYIKSNVPLHHCQYYKNNKTCMYYYHGAPCNNTYAKKENAIGLIRFTFGISHGDAVEIMNALNDIGWIEEAKCYNFIFNV